MTSDPARPAPRVPPGWVLLCTLLAGGAAALALAGAGWLGVAAIVLLIGCGCAVLLRWARWPPRLRTEDSPEQGGS